LLHLLATAGGAFEVVKAAHRLGEFGTKPGLATWQVWSNEALYVQVVC
jgi:hypothetical protein